MPFQTQPSLLIRPQHVEGWGLIRQPTLEVLNQKDPEAFHLLSDVNKHQFET